MSKDTTSLRLLGSPVNLTYRSKKKDDKNNIRNRPRSALQNSCFKPDNQERYKRPFSADTKERSPSTRSFYKAFSTELLQCQSVSCPAVIPYPAFPPGPVKTQTIRSEYPLITTIKVLPPTEDILGNTKCNNHAVKDHCSNASDYGSEDTFISLGTKIKAKAQLGTKAKNSPSGKNANRYRNIAKKGRKFMDNPPEDKVTNDYGMEIQITDKPQRASSPNKNRNHRERTPSPLSFKKRSYDAYFIPVEGLSQRIEDDLSGRVSFGSSNIHTEVEEAIDTYSRRLTLTKQQLSLVEEESTQDVENTSQRMSSLSPEAPLDAKKDQDNGKETGRDVYIVDKNDGYPKTQNFIQEPRTYASFYDDFRSSSFDFKPRTNATGTDVESKDSGYPDSGTNDDKAHKRNFSFPGTSSRKSNSFSCQLNRLEDQPKSLESSSSNEKDNYKTFPLDKKSQWAEPLNHSRLLYKDFFLKKEGHLALPPQNSPVKESNIPDINEAPAENKNEKGDETSDYPSYLLNSTTKAYTSKVIEDYKKELEAINSLHELTLKDIKTDPVSPTPLNIDRMFEQHSSFTDHKQESNDGPQEPNSSEKNKNNLGTTKNDISKVSTKELIQNYLKVKEGDAGKEALTKALKKYEPSKKYTNIGSKIDTNVSAFKQDWNNKAKVNTTLAPKPVTIRNQTEKNQFTQPTSARLDSVCTDKDIDSWMSLTVPSPRVDLEPLEAPKETKIEEPRLPDSEVYTTESSPHQNLNSLKKNSLSDPTVFTSIKVSSPSRYPHASTPRPEQKEPVNTSISENSFTQATYRRDLNPNSTVLDIYTMLKEIESYGDNPVTAVTNAEVPEPPKVQPHEDERTATPKDNFTEIFEFLEKVEQSANDALNVVTTPGQPSLPKLEALLKLSHMELAQRMITASLQLEERSCCIALLQESLTNHKEQMIQKISNIEKHSHRNNLKVKQECEEAIKRHQSFIDQLINDKKTLNHRIEQLVDERRSLEERWKRSAQALEERYKLELKNQHDKMIAAQQVARQRWVRQKAEKIKELTVKGLEGELREMAERQQKEVSDLKMFHAEQTGRMQAKHAAELEQLRRTLEDEKEAALVKERHLASSRLEKQILELELAHQEQRTRIVAEVRADTDRARAALAHRERQHRDELEKWREEQEKLIFEKQVQLEQEIAREREKVEDQLKQKQLELQEQFEQFKKDFEAEQQILFKKKVTEIAAQHKQERDREIEKAIESMDAEAQAGRKELQEALRRNKEQYEAELKELGETEQATLRRYRDAQARIRQTEDRCAKLEVTITQLETRNKVLTEKNIQFEKQLEEIRSQCDKAWQGKVDALQKEMEDMKRTHEEQMNQLYAKVKVAVARKDSAIQALTREAAKYQEKITLLEQKLQQQRKDFLKSK